MDKPTLNSRSIRNAIRDIERMSPKYSDQSTIDAALSDLLTGYRSTVPVFKEPIDVYRARHCDKPEYISELSYPPKNIVGRYGRGNAINQSIFYCATSRNVPFFELDCQTGEFITLSKWRVQPGMVVNHLGFTAETSEQLASNRDIESIYGFVKDTNSHSDLNEMVHEYLGFIFARPISKYEANDYYKLTSVLANKMINGDVLNGLLYPTVQMSANADNLLLKPEYVNDNLKFANVEYIEIIERNEDKFEINVLDSATKIDSNGKLQWSNRPLHWELNKAGQEVVAVVENGKWVVKDKKGNVLDKV